MNVDQLHTMATEATGLDDFGDPSYLEGLGVLASSFEDDARPSEIGRFAFEGMCVASLVNRARVTEHLLEHPELTRTAVRRPLFIAGMPRTGTTLLSHLLGADPANRGLYGWEAMATAPPAPADEWLGDPRRLAALESPGTADLNPEFRRIHEDPPDQPTECVTVLGQDFKSVHFETLFALPTYGSWLDHADLGSAYRWHRAVLQVLQSGRSGHWFLKTPGHSLALDVILEMHPEALVVVNHRDPLQTVPSVCSLVTTLGAPYAVADRSSERHDRWVDYLDRMCRELLDHRERQPHRFHDVAYADLVADPVATVRSIYAALGRELSAGAEEAMRTYLAENPQGKHGAHRYALEDFGYEPAPIAERFADYRRRFAREIRPPGA